VKTTGGISVSIGRAIRRVILIAVAVPLMLSDGAGAGSPEPLSLVGAHFVLTFGEGSGFACKGGYLSGQFVATGREAAVGDGTMSLRGLFGHLRLQQSWVSFNGEFGEGRIRATLRDTRPVAQGEILYRGHGQVVGNKDGLGGISFRGFLVATIYEHGQPTARKLMANVAYRMTTFPNRLVGGFGGGASEASAWSIATTGRPCEPK
jgi:hypothetical protein